MKLFVLFAQRKERYAGEYSPETLACFTEYENDDNPDYLEEQLEKAKANPDFVAVQLFAIDLGNGASETIRKVLLEPSNLKGNLLV